jgi:uncharacterized protein YuzE
MKIDYFPDVDQLSISFSNRKSVRTKEIAPGVVVDWDSRGNMVAIDIEHVSKKADVKKLLLNNKPVIPINPELIRNPFAVKKSV